MIMLILKFLAAVMYACREVHADMLEPSAEAYQRMAYQASTLFSYLSAIA
jgi:hypothetical protein